MKAVVAALLLLTLALGRATAQRPEFDIATVRRPPAGNATAIQINLGTFRNGTLVLSNTTLGECIQFAYGLTAQEQLAGPDWIRSREIRFDIVAKTAADADLEQARLMAQTLLADRLKLVIHHEPRLFSFLALVPARRGVKLAAQSEPPAAAVSNTAVAGRILAGRMRMPGLASLLSRFEGQLVVDKTGLAGAYQFTLEWTPNDRVADGGNAGAGPSLPTALDEQLGLRLESRKELLDVIVVDRAERIPTEN